MTEIVKILDTPLNLTKSSKYRNYLKYNLFPCILGYVIKIKVSEINAGILDPQLVAKFNGYSSVANKWSDGGRERSKKIGWGLRVGVGPAKVSSVNMLI